MSQEVLAALANIVNMAQQAAVFIQQSAQAQQGAQQGFGQPNNFAGQNVQQFAGQPQQAGTFGAGAGGAFGQPQQAAAPQVTPNMIQALIAPMVQNEQIKAALTAQMQQMGIQNLPDARPDQLPELYQRFQQVEQQARTAGMLGAAPAGGGQPSLI